MAQELKIRITDYKTIEEQLKALGASFIDEQTFTDIYFNQPAGEVLKLAKINDGFILQTLKATDGKFDIVKKEPLSQAEAEKVKTTLTEYHGIKKILHGKRRNYQLDTFLIVLSSIEDVGDFLILTGDNPKEEFITEKLQIKNPDYIRTSFDEIKSQNE